MVGDQNILPFNIRIHGVSFLHMYKFACGNEVPMFQVDSLHSLNQIIGHAKFRNREYGQVLYRGECHLHETLIPSLLRNTTKCDANVSKLNAIIKKFLENGDLTNVIKIQDAKGKDVIEGVLQHYGAYTRFIDIVDNHWVALWMGLYECQHIHQNNDVFYHYQRRELSLFDAVSIEKRFLQDPYQYLLLLAIPEMNQEIAGVYKNECFTYVDLRQALPSIFLRPHAQHGYVIRKNLGHGVSCQDYDMATEVVGILRLRIDKVASWLGEGELLSQGNLFPPYAFDTGYKKLLEYSDIFAESKHSVANYI